MAKRRRDLKLTIDTELSPEEIEKAEVWLDVDHGEEGGMEVRSRHRGLRPQVIGFDPDFLATHGWQLDPGAWSWKKGAASISAEALDDLVNVHPWAEWHVKKALAEGAIGFKITVTGEGRRDVSCYLSVEWPEPS